jgi:SAM-dependent methyltransferase
MTAAEAPTPTDQLVERLFTTTIGALELFSVHLGRRLGLYETLRDRGACTASDLAERAGIDERYAREWLEQQAVAGLLTVDDPTRDEDARRYSLPAGYESVLVDADDPAYVAPFAAMVVGVGGVLPEVVDAYRIGSGVPYEHYGADFRDGQGAINRPAFVHDLAGWIAAIPAVDARLRATPPARVADVGCGQGFSTLALAAAYPEADVTGLDVDEASIADAIRIAREREIDVAFIAVDGSELTGGPYDLTFIFEALHDMSDPVGVLRNVREGLAPSGVVFLVDERVADRFTAPGDEVERMMYGWSVVHCLAVSRAESPSAALGTVLRADTVRALATDAGYDTCDVLPIDHDFFRFYLLTQ